MENKKPWAEALNISEENYRKWVSELPKSKPLTLWCLENNKINTHHYLDWAKNHYGLCVLKKDFFEQSPNLTVWNQIKTVANWSHDLVPVHEWDGVIFVACVEPDAEINWSFPVKYLLADPDDLKHYWNRLNSAQSTEPASPETAPAEPSSEPIALGSEPPPLAEKPAPPTDQPEGIDLSQVSPPSSKSSSNPEDFFSEIELKTPDEEVAKMSNPEGVDHSGNHGGDPSGNQNSDENPEFEAPDGLGLDLNAKPPVLNLAKEGDENSSLLSLSNIENIIIKTGEPSSIPPAPTPTSESPDLNEEALDPDKIETKTSSSPMPELDSPVSAEKLTKIKTESGTKPNPKQDEINKKFREEIMPQLNSHFKKSMILLFNGTELIPWSWCSAWVQANESATHPIALKTPSAFRVVEKTKKPYIGHAVDTSVNKDFFESWSMKELPQHLVIQPLLHEKYLIGVYLGVMEEKKPTQDILKISEKVSDSIIKFLEANTNKSQAA